VDPDKTRAFNDKKIDVFRINWRWNKSAAFNAALSPLMHGGVDGIEQDGGVLQLLARTIEH
jgi:hypothetical protein